MNNILKFSVENFLSIKNKTVLNLLSSNEKNLSEHIVNLKDDINVNSLQFFIGKTAVGKSNILKAIYFLNFLIKIDADRRCNQEIPLLSFKGLENEPTSFEIMFNVNKSIFYYKLTLNKERILKEKLLYLKNVKMAKIFDREYIKEEDKYNYFYSRDFKDLKGLENKTLQNKLFLTSASQWSNNPKIRNVITFLNNSLIYNKDYFIDNKLYLFENINKACFKEELLKLLSLGNNNIDNIEVKKVNEKIIVNIIYPNFKINIDEESSGFIHLFNLSILILNAIRDKKILIIDNFDNNLHILLIKELINYILKKKIQSFISIDKLSTLNLDWLRKDEIIIVDKKDGNTNIKNLAELKNIYKSINIEELIN
jgi:AAA15 family ATPase/GTPase